MPANPLLDDVIYGSANQQNQGSGADVSQALPRQNGPFVVPPPTGFKITSQTSLYPGAKYTLTWIDVPKDIPIKGYRIYATVVNEIDPTVVGSAETSPATVTLRNTAAGAVRFTLQPFLANGQDLPIDRCPSCTGSVPEPTYLFTSGTVSVTINSSVPSGEGNTLTGISVADSSVAGFVTVTPREFVCVNGNDHFAAAIGLDSTAAGSSGDVSLWDGTGAGGLDSLGKSVFIEGGNVRITMKGAAPFIRLDNGTAGDVVIVEPGSTAGATAGAGGAIPATVEKYMKINVGGTDLRIPLYKP